MVKYYSTGCDKVVNNSVQYSPIMNRKNSIMKIIVISHVR